MEAVQIAVFILYVGYYWRSGVKSISMSSYENGNWSFVGFTLFMIIVALPFAQMSWPYRVAAWSLIIAGLSHRHHTPVVKQIHNVSSTAAILFGFIGLGSWLAVFVFLILLLPFYLYLKSRFLWYLEILAFVIIKLYNPIQAIIKPPSYS